MQVNLLTIDADVRRALRQDESNIAHKFPGEETRAFWTPWFRSLIARGTESLTREICERNHDADFYALETHALVAAFVQKLKEPIKISFHARRGAHAQSANIIIQMFFLVLSRIFINRGPRAARIDLSLFDAEMLNALKRPGNLRAALLCPNCESSNIQQQYDDETRALCLDCSALCRITQTKMDYDDPKRIVIAQRDLYDKRNHFGNCFDKYFGMHRSGSIPQHILDRVEARLENYGVLNHSATTREARFRRVTKQHIELIVKELELAKECADWQIIYFELVGSSHELQWIFCLREKVMQDFDEFHNSYNQLFRLNERETYNYQQLLFQMLWRNGHNCKPADFNLVKTTERKARHEQNYQHVFARLGWVYVH